MPSWRGGGEQDGMGKEELSWMHASVNHWKNSRSINSKGFGRRGAMNSALITNEMSREGGEGALNLSSLAWDLEPGRECPWGPHNEFLLCIQGRSLSRFLTAFFFFLIHVQLNFWKMSNHWRSSWHCSFLLPFSLDLCKAHEINSCLSLIRLWEGIWRGDLPETYSESSRKRFSMREKHISKGSDPLQGVL